MSNRGKTVIVGARVQRALADRLRAEAERLGVSVSALVEHLIETALGVGK